MDENTSADATDGPDDDELAIKRLHDAVTVLALLIVALLLYV